MDMKNTEATKGIEMTDQEMRDVLRQAMQDWNNATPEQRATAQAYAAEQAAKALMDQKVNRALGLEYDWATGEWK